MSKWNSLYSHNTFILTSQRILTTGYAAHNAPIGFEEGSSNRSGGAHMIWWYLVIVFAIPIDTLWKFNSSLLQITI